MCERRREQRERESAVSGGGGARARRLSILCLAAVPRVGAGRLAPFTGTPLIGVSTPAVDAAIRCVYWFIDRVLHSVNVVLKY